MAEVSSKCNDKLATGGQNDGDPFLETPSAENKIRTIYSLVPTWKKKKKKKLSPKFYTHLWFRAYNKHKRQTRTRVYLYCAIHSPCSLASRNILETKKGLNEKFTILCRSSREAERREGKVDDSLTDSNSNFMADILGKVTKQTLATLLGTLNVLG